MELFADLEPGTWTELAAGLGSAFIALVLGLMALRQGAKAHAYAAEAARWAEVAAEAQQTANKLTESALTVEFTADLTVDIHHSAQSESERGRAYESALEVGLRPGSASVWVHRMETAIAFFGLRGTTLYGDLFGGTDLHPVADNSLPRLLHPGELIRCENPWSFFSPVRDTRGYAAVTVFYSATEFSSSREAEVTVKVPEPSARTWAELGTGVGGDSARALDEDAAGQGADVSGT